MSLLNESAFLVAASDDSITNVQPYLVFASSKEAAIMKYQEEVRALDESFYEWVADRSVNASFAEQFFLTSKAATDRFTTSGVVAAEPEIVLSRIKNRFLARPDLGDIYWTYLQCGDESLLSPALLVFIATSETDQEHGMVALAIGDLPRLGSGRL